MSKKEKREGPLFVEILRCADDMALFVAREKRREGMLAKALPWLACTTTRLEVGGVVIKRREHYHLWGKKRNTYTVSIKVSDELGFLIKRTAPSQPRPDSKVESGRTVMDCSDFTSRRERNAMAQMSRLCPCG